MAGRHGFALSDEFWKTFAGRNWEQAPGVFPGVFPEAILSPEETFQAEKKLPVGKIL